MNKDLIGTGVALITPFDQHNQVDHSGLANLVNHAIDSGVEFLVLMGTTAESATLSKEEKEAAIQTIKETNNGRLPLVIGIGGNNTAQVIEEIKNTDLSDYTAILSASPSYNKPTQEGIYQHFKSIAESTDKDIILYNVPGRTASNVEASTTIRLAKEFKNIVAIKEASPNYMQSSLILNEKLEGFMVLSGDDAFGLPMTLAGGKGVISVIGQALPQYSEMIRSALDKKVDEAYALYYDILNLTEAIYDEGNPAGIKALMQVQGVCSSETRLPLVKASEDLELKIEKLFNKLK